MKLKTLAAAALMVVGVAAQAASVQSGSATFTGTTYDFNFEDTYLETLPSLSVTNLDLGGGVSLTSTAYTTIGANVQDLGENGAWTSFLDEGNRNGYFLATAFSRNRGELAFDFSNPVQKVGLFANQYQTTGVPNSMVVSAFDQYGNVLESFTVSIDTASDSYDAGMFIGFERASADIYGFAVADGTFVVDNLVTAVPEPESFAMLLAGLLGVAAAARRRKA